MGLCCSHVSKRNEVFDSVALLAYGSEHASCAFHSSEVCSRRVLEHANHVARDRRSFDLRTLISFSRKLPVMSVGEQPRRLSVKDKSHDLTPRIRACLIANSRPSLKAPWWMRSLPVPALTLSHRTHLSTCRQRSHFNTIVRSPYVSLYQSHEPRRSA
jgi:hypothetical protein